MPSDCYGYQLYAGLDRVCTVWFGWCVCVCVCVCVVKPWRVDASECVSKRHAHTLSF